MTESIFFFVFAGLVVASTGFMIFTKNVIHAAYGLALVLLCLAALYVLLNAEFLAVVQIFMYAGGVVVLLVFGIMLTNRNRKGPPMTGHRQVLLSSLIGLSLLAVLLKVTIGEKLNWTGQMIEQDQTREIGILFLTNHLLAFELIALLLLMALVGAAYLAKKSSENG